MADQDDDQLDEHTQEEHEVHSKIARQAFDVALKTCTDSNLCTTVMFEELIHALVAGAITHGFTLADMVGDLIDDYEHLRSLADLLPPGGNPRAH